MRIKIRKELDLDNPINLRELTPFQKIYVGIMTKWRNSDYYRTKVNKQLEEEYAKEVQRDEQLKELILVQIYKELMNNNTLGERGDICKTITLAINYKSKSSLERIISAKDFLQYNMEIVPENPDVRRAYYDMPVLLRISKKQL